MPKKISDYGAAVKKNDGWLYNIDTLNGGHYNNKLNIKLSTKGFEGSHTINGDDEHSSQGTLTHETGPIETTINAQHGGDLTLTITADLNVDGLKATFEGTHGENGITHSLTASHSHGCCKANAGVTIGTDTVFKTDAVFKMCKHSWFGFDLAYNLNTAMISKHNYGLFWFPTKGIHFSLRHQSCEEVSGLNFGHFIWSVYQRPSSNWRLAFESDLDFGSSKRSVKSTVGFEHQISDDTTIKGKVNSAGQSNWSFATELNKTTDVTINGGFNLGKVFMNPESEIGFGINFKF